MYEEQDLLGQICLAQLLSWMRDTYTLPFTDPDELGLDTGLTGRNLELDSWGLPPMKVYYPPRYTPEFLDQLLVEAIDFDYLRMTDPSATGAGDSLLALLYEIIGIVQDDMPPNGYFGNGSAAFFVDDTGQYGEQTLSMALSRIYWQVREEVALGYAPQAACLPRVPLPDVAQVRPRRTGWGAVALVVGALILLGGLNA